MPTFEYTAIDQQGQRISSTRFAETLAQLEASIAEQGAWLVKAKQSSRIGVARGSRLRPSRHAKAKRWDLINFYTQLDLLLQAGITLPAALHRLAQDLEDNRLGPVARRLSERVEAGTALPKAMMDFPRVFSSETIALIEAGEASGNLPESFAALAKNLEWRDGLIASARQAMIYPSAVLLAAGALVCLLMSVVVPRFRSLFVELDVELPAITRYVIATRDFIVSTWYLWAPFLVLAPLFLAAAQKAKGLALLRDRAVLSLPFFGEISRSLALSQFCVSLEALIRAGIPLARALELCSRQSRNSLIALAITRARQAVLEGKAMSEELAKHPIFTQTFLTMAQTGERSGQLDHAMSKVAEYYNTIVPRKIKAFFTFFEPAVILSLTGVVGAVALSLVLPIMSLWSAA